MALGLRGIRLCLRCLEIFRAQFRAILRAGAYGNLQIVYPMVSGVSEIKAANDLLEQALESLKSEGAAFNAQIPVGIMIEVPSAAIMAHELIKHTRFFGIGTNDLIQYTLAADRSNPNDLDIF